MDQPPQPLQDEYRFLFENSSDAILLTSPDGVIFWRGSPFDPQRKRHRLVITPNCSTGFLVRIV
jgi:hypothetical protein